MTPDAEFIGLWEFFRDGFIPESKIDLPLKPQHQHICDVIEMAFLGMLPPGIQYVVIKMPPRTGKTMIARAAVAWAEGYFPDAQWIYTSYAANIAEASLAHVAKAMRSPWYRDIFGDLIHGVKTEHVTTIGGGNMYAEGAGGSLLGKGGGLKRAAGGGIIVDDAAKPDEALSPLVANKLKLWVEHTLKHRRNSDTFCPILFIQQKLGPNDLPGYVELTYPNETLVLDFPAYVDSKGNACETDDATAAFPETWSLATMRSLRGTRLGRFVLATIYQQRSATLGGNLIPVDAFHRWDPKDLLKFERCVITVDTALKIKQSNDFSAAALWGLLDRRAYLIDLMHGKWEAPELLSSVITFWEKWTHDSLAPFIPRPRLIIEEKAAGTGLLQNLHRKGVPATGIERDIDKVRRVQTLALPYIEAGLVVIPKENSVPWIGKFTNECAEFAADGTAPHDDMVDTMVDGIEHLLGKPLSILHVLQSAPLPKPVGVGTAPRFPKPMQA